MYTISSSLSRSRLTVEARRAGSSASRLSPRYHLGSPYRLRSRAVGSASGMASEIVLLPAPAGPISSTSQGRSCAALLGAIRSARLPHADAKFLPPVGVRARRRAEGTSHPHLGGGL